MNEFIYHRNFDKLFAYAESTDYKVSTTAMRTLGLVIANESYGGKNRFIE